MWYSACNAIPEDDGTVKIYYGAADTNIGLAAGIDDIIEYADKAFIVCLEQYSIIISK